MGKNETNAAAAELQKKGEKKHQETLKSTCQRWHLSSERVQNQTRRARLHRCARGNTTAAEQHVKFCAAAGVAAHGVVLVEVYLARVHHFPAWTEAG